jgi:ATP-dependent DNA helicase RecQ
VAPAGGSGARPPAPRRREGGHFFTAAPSPTSAIRFDAAMDDLAAAAACDAEAIRAVVGHLARAGVVQPSPSAPDRVAGRVTGAWDATALAACRTAAQEAVHARWRQYRAVWGFVGDERCRRKAILDHFGDRTPPAPLGGCCDVCDPGLRPPAPPRGERRARGPAQLAQRPIVSPPEAAGLDDAILDVVAAANPPVGRTRAVEILRGSRSQVIVRHAYDGLPHYATFGHLRAEAILARIDALWEAGTLRATGGRFPKLELA